jgi:hypothetical protein
MKKCQAAYLSKLQRRKRQWKEPFASRSARRGIVDDDEVGDEIQDGEGGAVRGWEIVNITKHKRGFRSRLSIITKVPIQGKTDVTVKNSVAQKDELQDATQNEREARRAATTIFQRRSRLCSTVFA